MRTPYAATADAARIRPAALLFAPLTRHDTHCRSPAHRGACTFAVIGVHIRSHTESTLMPMCGRASPGLSLRMPAWIERGVPRMPTPGWDVQA